MSRNALVVRGGWAGHHPVETTDLFIPFLREHGFEVSVEDDPEVYADADRMSTIDLVVQCITMSQISAEAARGLRAAVEAGTGLAGWHGGIADSFRASTDYLQLVGGQFAAHPPVAEGEPREPGAESFRDHTIAMTELGRQHPITADIADFDLRTEQYWVLADGLNDVLATTSFPVEPGRPWSRELTVPAVWTRQWGAGRVFVATPGHDVAVLADPNVRAIVERGMLWAARTA
ncbi:ThuA domain-containing protein [Microbacterium sp. H1-D42]|uniref:ThuA domain-containing protein n=1 Tax=Microbacterium sp. H1-D42 TaxID=2925844 RepID=UPI001F536142|nr:ThuA domain-containing protein [Microbacterium sp. H1-D42]UNK70489.1 ThuA domain-containing protein [Microbacterium sp. H1-D42]